MVRARGQNWPMNSAAIWNGWGWNGRTCPRNRPGWPAYAAAAEALKARGLLYPCICTRKQIVQAGAVQGQEGLILPRHLQAYAARSGAARSMAARCDQGRWRPPDRLAWEDDFAGTIPGRSCGSG